MIDKIAASVADALAGLMALVGRRRLRQRMRRGA